MLLDNAALNSLRPVNRSEDDNESRVLSPISGILPKSLRSPQEKDTSNDLPGSLPSDVWLHCAVSDKTHEPDDINGDQGVRYYS